MFFFRRVFIDRITSTLGRSIFKTQEAADLRVILFHNLTKQIFANLKHHRKLMMFDVLLPV
jgi:hypothetical protein